MRQEADILKNSDWGDPLGAPALRSHSGRRTSDRILQAFHQACDENDLEVAGQLLKIVDVIVMRWRVSTKKLDRRNMEGLVAAHERLWFLRGTGMKTPFADLQPVQPPGNSP